MSSSRMGKSKKDPLQQRIPENPKYKNVKATIDTGCSLTKYMSKIEDIRQNYKFRKDEIFKRMKATTFVQLVVQVQRITTLESYDDIPATPDGSELMYRPDTADNEIQNIEGRSPAPSLALTAGDYGDRGDSVLDTSRSTFQSVARGVGELDVNQAPPAPSNKFVNDACPYLLLDVRDMDEFNQCHIISGTSYAKAYLSRATNYEIKEMLTYKNIPGKIIIIYDDDERIAPLVATTLVERGYDNLFMLSGGLKVISKLFPEGLISGTLPFSITAKKVTHPQMATQKNFTSDDIDRIEMYLDTALQDHSIGSRLSKASTTSSRLSKGTSASSRASNSGSLADRPAFKS